MALPANFGGRGNLVFSLGLFTQVGCEEGPEMFFFN